jgi:hypothetical protein
MAEDQQPSKPAAASGGSSSRTSGWDRAYDRLVNTSSQDSWSAKFRRRRWIEFAATFPSIETSTVLDLGGTVRSWTTSPVRPAHVTLVNVDLDESDAPPWIHQVAGDACDLPQEVRRGAWDLVFSNSVIEHVGGHSRRREFARSVRDLAPAYWVQTPYRYFPIEPHWLFPGFQFLPTSLRAQTDLRWWLKQDHPTDYPSAVAHVLLVELLNKTELAYYFPDSTIRSERLMGLTKSIIAVKVS